MEIQSIEISNFRSIKHALITVGELGLILVGKNEAGKSNVLKAIAALFGVYPIEASDYRKKISNEKIVESDRYIKAEVILSDADIDNMVDMVGKDGIGYPIAVLPEDFDYKRLLKKCFGRFWLRRDVKKGSKLFVEHDDIDFQKLNFKGISENEECFFKDKNGVNVDKQVEDWLERVLNEYYKKYAFQCQLWSYKEDYILPSQVSVEGFVGNPDTCKPLKNIFLLSGRDNIAKEFSDARSEDGDYHNLLDQVSEKVTKEFSKIWPDLKGTELVLSPDGGSIVIKVKGEAKYNFADRSDGFKHFVSIQLMLSTLSRIDRLGRRNIILIDEPDQGLYPSGARYLMQELKNISKKSYVVYTTHSPFMLDVKALDRHLIVEKVKDITSVKIYDQNSQYSDDELLRNAIGVTIFEVIKAKNIIFEGWLDKELFCKFCDENSLDGVGVTHIQGIKNVPTIVPLLNLAGKQFVVVSDSDQPSMEQKKKCIEDKQVKNDNWLDYGICIGNNSTLEDWFKLDYIKGKLRSIGYSIEKFDRGNTALRRIECCLPDELEDRKKVIMDIKQLLVSDATKDDMRPEYFDYIQKVFRTLM